jgi:hypothetical protein
MCGSQFETTHYPIAPKRSIRLSLLCFPPAKLKSRSREFLKEETDRFDELHRDHALHLQARPNLFARSKQRAREYRNVPRKLGWQLHWLIGRGAWLRLAWRWLSLALCSDWQSSE